MKFGKRQLVLATLVVALGAAVYLSWMITGDESLKVTETLENVSSEYGNAEFVSAGADEMLSEVMGDGVSSAEETENEETEDTETAETMAQARISRQQARDSASELLNEFLAKEGADTEEKTEAMQKVAQIADNILKENNIETLIKAKGYEDCLAVLENDQCSVMVKISLAQPNDAVIIKDIVHAQTGLSYDAIKIIEMK